MNDSAGTSDIRLRAVVESAPSGLLMIDIAGTIVLVNRQVEKMFGYPREELLGRPVEILVPGGVRDHHPAYRASYFAAPRVREMGAGRDLYGLRKDGTEVPVEIGLTPVITAEGVFVISSIVDITERKRAEAERARLEDRLRQAHKMEAVGTMAGRVAHDFNNILAAIMGCAEVLESHPLNEEGRQDLADLLKAAERGREIVQRILSFSRRHERSVRPVDLVSVVEEAVKLLRVTLPSSIDIKIVSSTRLPRVLAQATSIHQVILNLATNSAHAMPEGGQITILLDLVELQGHGGPERRGLTPGPYVRMQITDEGHGIGAEKLDQVFEPFFTDKPVGSGSGLGLAIVRDILHDHGGGVSIDSTPGVGTTVTCWFPGQRRPDEAEGSESREPERGHGERLLLVDDESAVRASAKRLLESVGYHVEAVRDAGEALRLIDGELAFDLILTDQSMPGMNGTELIAELRARGLDTPVVLLSGHLEEGGPDQILELGIAAIGLKPLRRAELADLVRSVLDRARSDRSASA